MLKLRLCCPEIRQRTCLVPKLWSLILLQRLLCLREIVFNQVEEGIVVLLGDTRVVEKERAIRDEGIGSL